MANTKYNYYGMLGLSPEVFSNNTEELTEIAKKKIYEWQHHKRIDVQNQANIHGQRILDAIDDTARWKAIYDEYRDAVIENILEQLILFVVNNKILLNNVEVIASKNNVSTNFVEEICERRGYAVVQESTLKKPCYSIEKLRPKNFLQIQEVQKLINELGAENLLDLFASPEISEMEIYISKFSSNEEILEAISTLENKWLNFSPNGSNSAQEVFIYRICAFFKKFLRDNSFSDYEQYLNYSGAKKILENICSLGIKSINPMAFNRTVDKLIQFTNGNIKEARDMLINHCITNNIVYPQ